MPVFCLLSFTQDDFLDAGAIETDDSSYSPDEDEVEFYMEEVEENKKFYGTP